jgi:tRNA pseudouridine38-40 synthase
MINRAMRAPLLERYALWMPEPLDGSAMNAAARLLIGQKDFGAFGTPPRGDNSVREVYRAHVERHDEHIIVEVEANAFLYRMMRRIVGTLTGVGKGAMSLDEFQRVIEKQRRTGEAVPPHGLCLIKVNYDFTDRSEG